MVSYVSITIPELYPYVMALAGFIAFECLAFGFISSSKRKTIFSQEFMNDFREKQKKTTGVDPGELKEGGYPDMGNGLYS